MFQGYKWTARCFARFGKELNKSKALSYLSIPAHNSDGKLQKQKKVQGRIQEVNRALESNLD